MREEKQEKEAEEEEEEGVHATLIDKVKGELKVIEGEILCNPRMMHAGEAQKHGTSMEDRR